MAPPRNVTKARQFSLRASEIVHLSRKAAMRQCLLRCTNPNVSFAATREVHHIGHRPEENHMIKTLLSAFQARLEKRRRYLSLIAEIESLNARDLRELRADPTEMRQEAWQSIYG